jgi:hypothetical protein
MNRASACLLALAVSACSPTMGDPRPLDLPAVAFIAPTAAEPGAAAQALAQANARIALVMGPTDPAWYGSVAAAARLEPATRPGVIGPELGAAFLGMEAVGDTTVEITYDGGSLRVHDALYDLGRTRLLDLLAFRIQDVGEARPALTALARYVATDVSPGAAVIMAVAVPSAAVGDSVARLLSPMYEGVTRCGVPPGSVEDVPVRMFIGPEARIYCRDARVTPTPAGDRVQADLVVGRRR